MKTITAILITLLLSVQWLCAQRPQHPDTLKHQIQNSGSDSVKVLLKSQLAYHYIRSDMDSAILILNEAAALAREIDFNRGLCRIYNNLAEIYRMKEDYTTSLQYGDSALNANTDTTFFELSSSIYTLKGIIHSRFADYHKALDYYYLALDELIKNNAENQAYRIYDNIGTAYCKLKNFEKGLEYYNKSLEILRENNLQQFYSLELMNIGIAYAEIHDYDGALNAFQEAVTWAEKFRNTGQLAFLNANLGHMYYKVQNYKDALVYLKKAEAMLANSPDIQLKTKVLANLSKTYAEVSNFNNARKYAAESMNLAAESGSLDDEATALRAYIVLNEQLGNYKKANEYYTYLYEVKDSVFTEEMNTKAAEMEVRFEVQEKEFRIDMLSKENELQKTVNEKQKQRIAFMLAGILALILIVVLIIVLYLRTKRKNRELTQRNLDLMKAEEENIKLKSDSDKYVDAKKDELLVQLEEIIKEEKVYRDPSINIDELSSKLNTNRTYLSKIINSYYDCNFKTFINRYRISEARHLLINPDYLNYTIEAIAGEVGFASKSAFNLVFKKETGLTPSVFQRNALK